MRFDSFAIKDSQVLTQIKAEIFKMSADIWPQVWLYPFYFNCFKSCDVICIK